MVDFLSAVKGAVSATLCGILSDLDKSVSYVESVVGTPQFGAETVRSLRRLACGNPSQQVGETVYPFSGGQCSFRYNTVGYFRAFNNSSTTRNWNGAGNVSANSSRLFGPFSTSGVFGPIVMVPRAGGHAGTYPASSGGLGGALDGSGGMGWQWGPTKTESFTVTPQNPADIDACGDPGRIGNPAPYVPAPVVQNITYDYSSTTINESVKVTIFAPIVAVGGMIYAPVTVVGPLFTLEGTVELSPNFEVNLRPMGAGKPGNNTDSAPPNPDQPSGNPAEEPTNRVITAVIVRVTDAQGGGATRIMQEDNQDIYAPRLGNVAFYVKSGSTGAWTEDYPVKGTNQWIQCPVPSGAIDVKGTPQPGYAMTLTPVWEVPLVPKGV